MVGNSHKQIKKRACDYWWSLWTDLKICLWLLVTTLDGPENLLVTIGDHFGRTQKFACMMTTPPLLITTLLVTISTHQCKLKRPSLAVLWWKLTSKIFELGLVAVRLALALLTCTSVSNLETRICIGHFSWIRVFRHFYFSRLFIRNSRMGIHTINRNIDTFHKVEHNLQIRDFQSFSIKNFLQLSKNFKPSLPAARAEDFSFIRFIAICISLWRWSWKIGC